MVIKIDFRKYYDSFSWSSLLDVLQACCFPENFYMIQKISPRSSQRLYFSMACLDSGLSAWMVCSRETSLTLHLYRLLWHDATTHKHGLRPIRDDISRLFSSALTTHWFLFAHPQICSTPTNELEKTCAYKMYICCWNSITKLCTIHSLHRETGSQTYHLQRLARA
jgi:hypothetical protein